MSHRKPALVLAGSLLLGLLGGSVLPLGEVGLLVAVAGFVWAARTVEGFAGGALRGAVAGALAGFLVLGIGFRLAMRVVAITDPARTPEFSVPGTAFILIGLGLLVGATVGAYLGGLAHLLRLGRATVLTLATTAIALLVFGDSEVRSELFELGLGAWVNIPMFGAIVVGYGWAQDGIARRLERRAADRQAVRAVAETAPVP